MSEEEKSNWFNIGYESDYFIFAAMDEKRDIFYNVSKTPEYAKEGSGLTNESGGYYSLKYIADIKNIPLSKKDLRVFEKRAESEFGVLVCPQCESPARIEGYKFICETCGLGK